MKFNFTSRNKDVTRNHEGERAYALIDELELYSTVVTSMLSDTFYEGAKDRVERIAQLVRKVDPEFVAKLAVYARTEMNLRSVPMLLVVELARVHSGDNLVARTVERVVQRADEITELLACYQWRNAREGVKKLSRVSNQILKGLRAAFNRFDEYQFAKYNRSGADVKLRDALFLVHPKAKDAAQQEIFNKIVTDSLKTPYTWETELSALGQTMFADEAEKNAAFAAKWEELVASRKMGYMAMLRNLRNILTAGAGRQTVEAACDFIGDAERVRNSKQLPFRFLSAYRETKDVDSPDTQRVVDALESAVLASAANINGFDADTSVLLACDVSGSMFSPISPKSKVKSYDIGLLLAMLLRNRCRNVIAGMFGDTWKTIAIPGKGILSAVDVMYRREGEVGYSTNGYKVIDWLIGQRIKIDKVMMFTDCQMWNSRYDGSSFEKSWDRYKKIAPDAKLYLFDLSGYGNSPLRMTREDVVLISGWSDKVFDVLQALENGPDALKAIKAIEV